MELGFHIDLSRSIVNKKHIHIWFCLVMLLPGDVWLGSPAGASSVFETDAQRATLAAGRERARERVTELSWWGSNCQSQKSKRRHFHIHKYLAHSWRFAVRFLWKVWTCFLERKRSRRLKPLQPPRRATPLKTLR